MQKELMSMVTTFCECASLNNCKSTGIDPQSWVANAIADILYTLLCAHTVADLGGI